MAHAFYESTEKAGQVDLCEHEAWSLYGGFQASQTYTLEPCFNRDIASDTFVILCTGEGNDKRTLNLMPAWAPQGNYLNKNSAQYLGNVKYRFVFQSLGILTQLRL